jgi:hypothetical protein
MEPKHARRHRVRKAEYPLNIPRYQDQRYRSLSAIAREVTDTRRNGLLFFGLTERPLNNGSRVSIYRSAKELADLLTTLGNCATAV